MAKEITRALGDGLAISVATAIPIEERILVEKPEVTNLWLNIKTLFRNYWGSIENPSSYSQARLIGDFMEEVVDLKKIMELQNIEVVVYNTVETKALTGRFKHAKIKIPHTDKQKTYAAIERSAANMAMNLLPTEWKRDFMTKLYGAQGQRVHMLTHYPLDLLSRYEFGDLLLLESHTGTVKSPTEWITKLTKHSDYRHLPFNILTMQVLGDDSTQFYAQSSKVKKEFLMISTEGRWNPTTSIPKVSSDIKKYGQEHKQLFLDMLAVKLI